MFVGRRMFALLDTSGALVIKLSPERVGEQVQRKQGYRWHPGTGKPLQEYVAIPYARRAAWLPWARESRAYMSSKG